MIQSFAARKNHLLREDIRALREAPENVVFEENGYFSLKTLLNQANRICNHAFFTPDKAQLFVGRRFY
jgi:hypothetical protein